MQQKKLTHKQARFVEEYLIDLNATQAARRAGYSAKTAGQMGERLLKKVEIKQAIDRAIKKRCEATERTAKDVVRDIEKLKDEAWKDGDLKTALKALELEGKHRGAFTERLDHTSSDGTMSLMPTNIIVNFVDPEEESD